MKKTTPTEKTSAKCQDCHCHSRGFNRGGSGDSPLYGIGLIGAAFYFLPGSNGLSEWLWHIFQTITWPGFLVYHLLQFVGIGK